MNITISITDAESAAISLVAVDIDDWLQNAASGRASAALAEFKQSDDYASVMVFALQAGVDITDPGAVLAYGIGADLIETAAQRNARIEAEAAEARTPG